MKIYYVANVRMPTSKAHGIQLAKMSEALMENGVDLRLIVPRFSQSEGNDPTSFYGLRQKLPVTTVPVLDLSGKSRFGFNFKAFTFAVSSFFHLLREKIPSDAIVYTIDLDQFSFFLLPFLRRPLFIEVHGSKQNTFFTRFFFRRAKGVIAVSAAVKESLVKTFGIPSEKIIVCPNSIDPEMFKDLPSGVDARKELGLPLQYHIFLYVGRMYDWKGLEVLPKAARSLGANGAVYCVGGNSEEFMSVTGEKYLPSNLVCVGKRDFPEIPLWLAAADFLLVTATKKNEYSYRETSPMKLFEYMAARRPVLAADTPALRGVTNDEEVVFYEPDNADDLVAKIQYSLAHKAELAANAERAYRKIAGFSWKKRGETVVSFIKRQCA